MQAGDEWYMRAFWELDTERSLGFSLGPIPWSSIVSYAERSGLETGMIEVVVRVIRRLDNEYRKWNEGEQKRRKKIREDEAEDR